MYFSVILFRLKWAPAGLYPAASVPQRALVLQQGATSPVLTFCRQSRQYECDKDHPAICIWFGLRRSVLKSVSRDDLSSWPSSLVLCACLVVRQTLQLLLACAGAHHHVQNVNVIVVVFTGVPQGQAVLYILGECDTFCTISRA
jgi:hypothetical protein